MGRQLDWDIENSEPAETMRFGGIVYTVQPRKSKSLLELRRADYGEGFEMGKLGHQGRIFHKSHKSPNLEGADKVMEVFRNEVVIGDTVAFGGKDWVYAIDRSEFGEDSITDEDELKYRLGSSPKMVGGVKVSPNNLIRAVRRRNTKSPFLYTHEEVRESNVPILFMGYKEASENLAEVSRITGKPIFMSVPLWGVIRVPDLFEDDDRLCLDGGGWNVNGDRYSFGVRK